MRRHSCFMYFIFALVAFGTPAFAQDDLQLSGVMQGKRPTAIVNDKVVGAGDSVGIYRVLEISADHVVFESRSGTITKYLKEPETKTAKPVPSKPQAAVQKPSNPPPASSGTQPGNKAREHLNNSMEYLRQGDELLKGDLKFERLYAKAVSLCDDAEREAQVALKGMSDAANRGQVNDIIARIRKAKEAILRERADFNTRVRSIVAAKKVITGMTSQDVISSWGAPLTKTVSGDVERWMYQDNNGYQKELTFNSGILVAF